VTETCQLSLSSDAFRLEERNLPASLARDLAGRTIEVKVLPEEAALTRQVGPDDYPLLIDPQGNYWNDWQPLRVLCTDSEGREWRLPRGWLSESPVSSEAPLEAYCGVSQKIAFAEMMNLPSQWDMWEINLPWEVVAEAHRTQPAMVEVCLSPGEPATVSWRDANGKVWRIPYDWRKRRVKLPEFSVLASQGIPEDVAQEYAGKIVSVNYHPGTLCCLPDCYRFRDSSHNRWPVRIRDCTLIGVGDAPAPATL
jgi:hypothetical protein